MHGRDFGSSEYSSQLQLQRQSSIDAVDGFAVHGDGDDAKAEPSPSPSPHPYPRRRQHHPSSFTSPSHTPPSSSLPYHPFPPKRQASAPTFLPHPPLPHSTLPPSSPLSSLLSSSPSPRRSSSLFTHPTPSPLMRDVSLHADTALTPGRWDRDLGTSPSSPTYTRGEATGGVGAGWDDDGGGTAGREFRAKVRDAFEENVRRIEERMEDMEGRVRERLLAELEQRQQRALKAMQLQVTKVRAVEEEEKEQLRDAGHEQRLLRDEVEHVREQQRALKKRLVQLAAGEDGRQRRMDELERSLDDSRAVAPLPSPEQSSELASVTQHLRDQQTAVERVERQLAQLTQSAAAVHPVHSPLSMTNTARGVWPRGVGLTDSSSTTGLLLTHAGIPPVTLHSLSTRLARLEYDLASHARALNEQLSALQSSLSSLSSSSAALLHSSLQPLKASLKQSQAACDDLPPLQRRLLMVEEDGRRMRARQEEDWAAVKAAVERTREETEKEVRRMASLVGRSGEAQVEEVAVTKQQRQWLEEDRQERQKEDKREREERARQWKEDRAGYQRELSALSEEVRQAAQRGVKEAAAELDRRVKDAVKDHWLAEKEERGWSDLLAQVERGERRLCEEAEGVRHATREVRDVREELSRFRRHVDCVVEDMRAAVKAQQSTVAPLLPPQTFHIHATQPATHSPVPPASPPRPAPTLLMPPQPAFQVQTAPPVPQSLPFGVPTVSPAAPLQPTAFVRPMIVPNVLSSSVVSDPTHEPADSSPSTAPPSVTSQLTASRALEEREAEVKAGALEKECQMEQARLREAGRVSERERESEQCKEAQRPAQAEAAAAEAAAVQRAAMERRAVLLKREGEEERAAAVLRRQQEEQEAKTEQATRSRLAFAAAEAQRREEEAEAVQRELQMAQTAAAAAAVQRKADEAEANRRLQEAAAAKGRSNSSSPLVTSSMFSPTIPFQPAASTVSASSSPVAAASSRWTADGCAELSLLARNLPVVSRTEQRSTLLLTIAPPSTASLPSTPSCTALDVTDPAKLYTAGPYDAERTFLLHPLPSWTSAAAPSKLSVYERRVAGGADVDDLVGSCWLQVDEMWKRKGSFFTLQLTGETQWKSEQLRTKRTTVLCKLTLPSPPALKAVRERLEAKESSSASAASPSQLRAVPPAPGSGASASPASREASPASSPASSNAQPDRAALSSSSSPSAVLATATPPLSRLSAASSPALNLSRSSTVAASEPAVLDVDDDSSDSDDEAEVTLSVPLQIATSSSSASASTVPQPAVPSASAVGQRSLFSTASATASPHPPLAQSAGMSSPTILSTMRQAAAPVMEARPLASPASDESSSSDDDDEVVERVVMKAATESVVIREAREPLPPTRMALAAASAAKPELPSTVTTTTPPQSQPPLPQTVSIAGMPVPPARLSFAPGPGQGAGVAAASPSSRRGLPSLSSIATTLSGPRPPSTAPSSALPLRASQAPVSRAPPPTRPPFAVSDDDHGAELSISANDHSHADDDLDLTLSEDEQH